MYPLYLHNNMEESTIKFRVSAKLKDAFSKAVGEKLVSARLRKEMKRIVKQANKIHHA